jgi:hypothetical protein
MPDAARTLGGTEVDVMPAEVAGSVGEAAPPPPLAETVGVEAGVPLGRSEPNAARFCGGGGANIGFGVP